MYFYSFRLLLIILLSIISYILLMIFNVEINMLLLRFIILIILFLLFIFNYFPIENLFISFKTPKSAFKSVYIDKYIDCIMGKNSALLIYKSFGTYSQTIMPMKNDKWKLPTPFTYQEVFYHQYKNYEIYLYKTNKSEEYYLKLYKRNKPKNSNIDIIKDNVGTDFSKQRFSDFRHVTYYAYLSDKLNNYNLLINESEIKIDI